MWHFKLHTKKIIQSYLRQNKNIHLIYHQLSHMRQFCRGNIWLPDHYVIFWNTIWSASLSLQVINRAIRTSSSTITVVVPWIIHPWLLVQGLITAKALILFQEIGLLLNISRHAAVAVRIIITSLQLCIDSTGKGMRKIQWGKQNSERESTAPKRHIHFIRLKHLE